jgi:hypothetical protein
MWVIVFVSKWARNRKGKEVAQRGANRFPDVNSTTAEVISRGGGGAVVSASVLYTAMDLALAVLW